MVNFASYRTLCFLLTDSKILLGTKKRGIGVSNYNGFGGKIDYNETAEDGVIREIGEEIGVLVEKKDLDYRATIDFYFPAKPEWNQRVYVYLARRWKGEPTESDEMKPQWFDIDQIPYSGMWSSDRIWLPLLLQGKRFDATFIWKDDNKTVDKYEIKER